MTLEEVVVTATRRPELIGYQDHIAGYLENAVLAADPIDCSAGFRAPAGTLVIPGYPAFTRKDINSEDIWGGRAALSWKPTDAPSVDLGLTAQSVALNSEPGAQPAFGDFAVQSVRQMHPETARSSR